MQNGLYCYCRNIEVNLKPGTTEPEVTSGFTGSIFIRIAGHSNLQLQADRNKAYRRQLNKFALTFALSIFVHKA
ncbi:hypothetical protein AT746_16625 [Lacimicrobium alkaliphilum]|uniref:Uncharacterized protein n=1 Tax=Lacimicrobium alkaliphilum TaxID=1526571 RepID=A0A0U3ALR6_9ALTE|nr:hypothetical protein AT746_16625 [Lacimicrobium alkaliphilum]